MGIVAGVTVAYVVSVDVVDELTQPFLALLGGFSAPAIYLVLTRIIEAIETLFRGDRGERVYANAEALVARANADAAIERARLATKALKLREAADQLLPGEALRGEFAELLDDLLSPDEVEVLPESVILPGEEQQGRQA